MKTPKAILFDMGDTLINYNNFNPLRGTKKIMEYADNPNNVSPEKVQKFADKLNVEFDEIKNENNIEISCKNFHRLIFEMYGVKTHKSPLELELIFKFNAWELELVKGIIEILEYLQVKNIRLAVLSNSSFSEKALIQELEHFAIEKYFEFVISTAEYCIRKPDKRIFNITLNKLGLNADEVWYVGNSFKYDVIGAHNAKLKPVQFNENCLKAESNISYLEVQNYKELMNKLKSIN